MGEILFCLLVFTPNPFMGDIPLYVVEEKFTKHDRWIKYKFNKEDTDYYYTTTNPNMVLISCKVADTLNSEK